MHIFCDESGGCALSEQCFLAIGVLIEPSQAAQVIRRFRKATKINSEIHGHELDAKQREIFFEQLAKNAESVSAALVCHRKDTVGGWGMKEVPEHILRSEMIVEACELIASEARPSSMIAERIS